MTTTSSPGSDRYRDYQTERTRCWRLAVTEAGAAEADALVVTSVTVASFSSHFATVWKVPGAALSSMVARAGRQSARCGSREPNGVRHPVRAGGIVG